MVRPNTTLKRPRFPLPFISSISIINYASYLPLGDEFYTDVLQELQKARRYIFVEYFIISKGILWDSILKILEQKAKEGVEVRILYDGMNSFSNLPHDYPKELEAKGIRCRIFNPIRPAISLCVVLLFYLIFLHTKHHFNTYLLMWLQHIIENIIGRKKKSHRTYRK